MGVKRQTEGASFWQKGERYSFHNHTGRSIRGVGRRHQNEGGERLRERRKPSLGQVNAGGKRKREKPDIDEKES